jgi:hypothetical protein
MLQRKYSKVNVTEKVKLEGKGKLEFTNPGGTTHMVTPTVETLSAARTVTADESGKTFLLALAGGFAVTLPPPVYGARFTFIASISPTTAYTVITSGSANIIKGFAVNAAGAAVTPLSDGDTITFVANQALAGDQVTVVSDGTSWFMSGFAQVAAGITNTKAT